MCEQHDSDGRTEMHRRVQAWFARDSVHSAGIRLPYRVPNSRTTWRDDARQRKADRNWRGHEVHSCAAAGPTARRQPRHSGKGSTVLQKVGGLHKKRKFAQRLVSDPKSAGLSRATMSNSEGHRRTPLLRHAIYEIGVAAEVLRALQKRGSTARPESVEISNCPALCTRGVDSGGAV